MDFGRANSTMGAQSKNKFSSGKFSSCLFALHIATATFYAPLGIQVDKSTNEVSPM
jgi:hypothetical protein